MDYRIAYFEAAATQTYRMRGASNSKCNLHDMYLIYIKIIGVLVERRNLSIKYIDVDSAIGTIYSISKCAGVCSCECVSYMYLIKALVRHKQ